MSARNVFMCLWLTGTLVCWATALPLFANNTSVVMAVDPQLLAHSSSDT